MKRFVVAGWMLAACAPDRYDPVVCLDEEATLVAALCLVPCDVDTRTLTCEASLDATSGEASLEVDVAGSCSGSEATGTRCMVAPCLSEAESAATSVVVVDGVRSETSQLGSCPENQE